MLTMQSQNTLVKLVRVWQTLDDDFRAPWSAIRRVRRHANSSLVIIFCLKRDF